MEMMAYIDPTAGGLLLQAVFGGVAAFFVLFWNRIKRFLGFSKAAASTPSTPPVDPPPPPSP